jgi:enolase
VSIEGKEYRLLSFTDPFDQDDWEGYAAFTAKVGKKV